MKKFAELIKDLDSTNKTTEKISYITQYLSSANDSDKLWMIFLLSGGRVKKNFTTPELRQWAVEASGIPQWLFDESYAFVGDLAETISLVIPNANVKSEYSLSELVGIIGNKKKSEKDDTKQSVFDVWKVLGRRELFAFNKLMTGGFRLGVSSGILINAIAAHESAEKDVIAFRLSGNWDPYNTTYSALIRGENEFLNLSKPYPFHLAYPVEGNVEDLGEYSEWSAEWKWDGIRAQLIRRGGELFIWSRGEEIITEKFPELTFALKIIPDGTVLDGEILCFNDGRPMNFNVLQKRIGRKNLTSKILKEAPVVFIAYDIIEYECKDIRKDSLESRRIKLEKVLSANEDCALKLSPLIIFNYWNELRKIREQSQENGTEGVMIKRKVSEYQTGRKKGSWWKWKIDPMTVDAVMIYAQAGHGRRSGLFTDYTFAVWDNEKLVTIAKAYSGLTNKEIEEVDKFVKENTVERFGPVRTVSPELVFEIAFEGIAESSRHKSGIALRFPRISRWRKDKKASEADTITELRKLIKK
jgi:DNA ligase-1